MNTKLHCDECGKPIDNLFEAKKQGWYMSSKLSISGIPWYMLCQKCFRMSILSKYVRL